MQLNQSKRKGKAALKIALVMAWYKVTNAMLRLMETCLFAANRKEPEHILIFRTGSLGDNLCAIPAIVAIRKKYPHAPLDILANAGSANLVTFNKLLHPDYYDDIIDYMGYGKKALYTLLIKRKYDSVVYLPQTGTSWLNLVRDMLFFRFIAPAGFGWEKSTINFFRKTQEKYIQFDNEVVRLSKLLRRHGIQVEEQNFPLNTSTADQAFVDDYFSRNRLLDKQQNIAVVVGAKRPQNRWPIDHFKQVVDHFAPEYNIILIGGPEDNALVTPLSGIHNVYNCCGYFTPAQSALAFKKCILTISNDTGPMHLSYAVGTPTIALFSSRDFPGKWFPPDNGRNKIYRTPDVACAVCLSETCADNICMQAIKPQEVIGYTEQLLNDLL